MLNLSSADIHVVCGCIKDFLRGLREPLIPTNLWANFSNAVQMIDDKDIEQQLIAAINFLPQANRDTMAYLILHLQRFVFPLILNSLREINFFFFSNCFQSDSESQAGKLFKCPLRTWQKSSVQLCWAIHVPILTIMQFYPRQWCKKM